MAKKILGSFQRPTFKAPKLPVPPKTFSVPRPVTAVAQAIRGVQAKVSKFTADPFGVVNPTLTSIKAQLHANAQSTLKAEASAVRLPAAIPQTVAADLSTARTFQTALNKPLGSDIGRLDEFGTIPEQ